MGIPESCFDRLAAAYPEQLEHRGVWLSSWTQIENPVLSRTLEWFFKNWARCPTIVEFKEETSRERDRQRTAHRRDIINACPKCVSGWVVTNWEKWIAKPCEDCRPEQFDRWQTGKYLPS